MRTSPREGARTLFVSMARVSPEAAEASIVGLDGRSHLLSELWSERPCVLVFLRHFG